MSTFFFPPSPTPHPLSGAVIYDPYRDIAGRNILPVGSDNFVTGWGQASTIYAGDVELVTISDYPCNIPGIGDVVAKRLVGNGAGANTLKYVATLSGFTSPHNTTWSCYAKKLSGNAKLYVSGIGTADIGTTMERVSLTATVNNAYSRCEFRTANISDVLDIVVYQPFAGFALAPYSAPAGLPTSALNYGIGSSLHNAQLGSAAGADTNDPTWGATGLVFGADDYLKITSSWFDDMAAFTVVTAMAIPTIGTAPRIFDKTNRYAFLDSTAGYRLSLAQIFLDGFLQWRTDSLPPTGNAVLAVAYKSNLPSFWYGAIKQTAILSAGTATGVPSSDASNDLFVANRAAADRGLSNAIYLQVWFPRILSDAQYLAAYRYIKSLLAARGVTV